LNNHRSTLLGVTVLTLFLSGCGDKQDKTSANQDNLESRDNMENTSSQTQINQLTEQEKEDGWELLFDGKTTEGWRGYGKDSFPSGWVIEDGALKVQGTGAGEAGGG